jgi:two-component system phosphate regulon response regulator OmpR
MRATIPLADDAPHILVVDDDSRIRSLLSRFLQGNGYRVTTAANASDAREQLGGLAFDLLVLDVMMPGENGFDLARSIRMASDVPVLMLTARTEVDDRLLGLEIGADDYLAKPFDPRELLLRITSILRRVTAAPPAVASSGPDAVRFGPYQFHLGKGELRNGDELVRITNREREILRQLSQALGGTVAREMLADPESGANERTIDVQITRLRRKLDDDATNPIWLQTVRGIGYRLVVDGL